MNITMKVIGADLAAAQFLAKSAAVDAALTQVISSQGEQLRLTIQAAASGRPGPNVITGQFRGGIRLEVDRGPGHASATVSSDAPQAWRLEMGFRGVDSRGRRYNQPPYPSFGPGFDAIAPNIPVMVSIAIGAVL